MRRTEIDGENPGTDANQADVLSRSAARGTSVLQFPRRADTAALGGSAAGGDPPSPPAPFEPLGDAVAAVVLRLRGGFPRVKVLAPVLREEEEDRDQR